MVGAVLGLMLGIGLACVREMYDRRIRSRDDAQDISDVPLLAYISRDRRRGRSRFTGWSRLFARKGPATA